MKIRYLVIAATALLLAGCASYGYRGGSGDYYYGRSSGTYGAPYGSVGYGTYGGFRGSVGYGWGYPYYSPYYYGRSYWPRHYYGTRYPYHGSYPGYYPSRPIIVRPRPGNDRPRESRPNAPWRNLRDVTRAEHRERPQRMDRRPGGPRAQGDRQRVRPSIPNARRPEAGTGRSPWRAGPGRSHEGPRRSGPRPDRVRATPVTPRHSAPPVRQRPVSAGSRRGGSGAAAAERDTGPIQRR